MTERSFERGPDCDACGSATHIQDDGYYNPDETYTCERCAEKERRQERAAAVGHFLTPPEPRR